ncbi:alanine/glycine:cation symporter family protein [candidate division KSB1 bacterium]
MIDVILNYADKFNQILWGPWTLILIASVAVYLTIRSGFFQIRQFKFISKNTFGRMFEKGRSDKKGRMTPFQATTTALASTVGMGNIAGVATALSIGGPGAIFWMWLLATLGMMSKTAEITLAVHYRDVDENGTLHGGPMYYIKKGLGWNYLSKQFSIGVLVACLLSSTLLQPHTVGRALLSSYQINPYLTASVMSFVTAIVVIGGIKRIGKFCESLVPVMSVLYIIFGVIIFVTNYQKIPEVFSMIFKYAFSPLPAVGGVAGITVMEAIRNGMRRGMLSNEAGQGTAPMAHATADTDHPFQQGMWGAFEVFIDTIVICTITSFAVLSTGVLDSGESGIELVMLAFSSVFPDNIADILLSICILTFCLTTQIGFFIYYETAAVHVFGKRSMHFFKWFYLLPGIVFAGVSNVDKLWWFADISVGVCCIPNLIALLALNGVFFKLMTDYLSGKKEYSTANIDISKDYIKKANQTKYSITGN